MRKGRLPFLATGPFFCLLLPACGSSTAPGSEESRRLDNAEEMLNSAPSELSNIDAGELEQRERNAP
jgi:hypothetical protein